MVLAIWFNLGDNWIHNKEGWNRCLENRVYMLRLLKPELMTSPFYSEEVRARINARAGVSPVVEQDPVAPNERMQTLESEVVKLRVEVDRLARIIDGFANLAMSSTGQPVADKSKKQRKVRIYSEEERKAIHERLQVGQLR